MSDIKIKISAGFTQETSNAYAFGSVRHIITDGERKVFGILDADLKRKVGAFFTGKEPQDVFVRSPTPWGDLYKIYNWEEVYTVLTPIETKILSVETVPTIVSKMNFKNESNKKATYNGKLTEQVETTVGTSWSDSNTLSFNQEVSYDVKFLGVGIGGKTSFGFQHQWGKNGEESRATTIGTETGVTVELEPGEAVVAELNANLGKMKVRITYEARLTGQIATHYGSGIVFGPHIALILGASNSVKITEDIEIGFYSEARVNVKNLTGETLKFERVPCCL